MAADSWQAGWDGVLHAGIGMKPPLLQCQAALRAGESNLALGTESMAILLSTPLGTFSKANYHPSC